MFEYLLVVASTLIYFRVFHTNPPKITRAVQTQTDPWYPLQVLDLMDTESESELNCSVQFNVVEWESDSSSIELVPMKRHGLKERHPQS